MKSFLSLVTVLFIPMTMLWRTTRGFQHLQRGPRNGPILTTTTTTRLFAKKSKTTRMRQGDFWHATLTDVWRPTVQDVERISWGKPAKQKGTGSRGVPHRLNDEERQQFDRARQKGFLEVAGSAWRSQRREAPLLNTHRSLCDARGQASIVLHKGSTDADDAVVVDISPLRAPETFHRIAQVLLEHHAGGQITAAADQESENDQETDAVSEEKDENPWNNRPIYQLPPYCISWESLSRAQAKELGKMLSQSFDTAEGKRAPSQKPVGVKPGKSRRHGGYGIG